MRLIDIDFVEKKKENSMKNNVEEAVKELFRILMYNGNESPLRWHKVDEAHNTVYISNSDYDVVCRVKIYATFSKDAPIGVYFYVYFIGDKYRSAAKEVKDPRIIGTTSEDGYKFTLPKYVVDFVREVVNKADNVVDRIGRTKEGSIMMKWEVRTPVTTNDLPTIRAVDVIFNDPATIIIWADGTKTVVKAENEPFDPEKGLAMAISKKVLGNKYDYYDVFKKYVGRYEKKQKKGKK